MGEYYKLAVAERDMSVKPNNLRRSDLIPAVLYFHGSDNHNLSINKKVLMTAIHSGNRVFEIEMEGKEQFVMIKDVQYHPVTDDIIHLDLLRVKRSEKMTIAVQVEFTGDCHGVREGGILVHNLNSIEISCFPTDVPETILVDIANLELNNSMTVADVHVSDEIEILTDKSLVLVTVNLPREEEVIEVSEEIEEGEEAKETEDGEESTGKDESTENS